MIQFFCTSCGKRIALQARPQGGQAQCPFCQAVVGVPETSQAQGPTIPTGRNYYGSATVEASDVLVPLGLPLITEACAMCGSTENLQSARKKFVWVSPWAYLSLFFTLIALLIVVLVLQKRSEIDMLLCGRCRSRWTLSAILYPLGVLVGLFALPIAGGFAGDAINSSVGGAIGALLGFTSWIAAAIAARFLWIGKVQMLVRRIDERGTRLSHPNIALIQAMLQAQE